MKEEKHFEVLSTKIDPAMAEVLNACCDALGVDVYHLLQWFAYTIIRASAPWHELDPRIQKLMAMLESDAGWQESFNIANPGKLKIAQIILILEQHGRKGFGAVMVDKPFMSDVRQTECVDDILERVTQVTMRGIYRRLRLLGGEMQCEHLSDVLLTMCERQNMMNAVDHDNIELPGMGDHADNGRQMAFGKKTKAKQYRTPDSVAEDHRYHQTHIVFDDYDREVSDYEVQDWEGEIRQREEPPEDELMRPFDVEW